MGKNDSDLFKLQRELEFQNSELKRVNQELEFSKKKYVDLFNKAPQAYVVYDVSGKITAVNRAFCELVGNPKGELVNKNISDFLYSGSRNTYEYYIKEISENIDNLYDVELKFKNNTGVVCTRFISNYYDVGDGYYIRSSVFDITASILRVKQIEAEKEKFSILSCLSDNVIFEYDLENRNLIYFKSSNGEPGISNVMVELRNTLLSEELIYDKDVENFERLYASVYDGIDFFKSSLRYRYPDGSYQWIKIQGKRYSNGLDKHCKIVGSIINIDNETKEYTKLKDKATKDPLTRLLSKLATKEAVQDFIAESVAGNTGIHALMIIDIDNFKSVNDTLGHLVGDTVLMQVASILKKTFRSTDIVGRIGGDEFLVFLKNVDHLSVVSDRADSVCKKIKAACNEKGISYNISASIGIGILPRDGQTYDDLFQKADMALYSVKYNGKNRFEIYNEAISYVKKTTDNNENEPFSITQIRKTISPIIKDRIESFVYETVYHTQDIELSLSAILGEIGEYFGLSRVSIIQLGKNESESVVSAEWCSKGIAPSKDILKNSIFNHNSSYVNNAVGRIIYNCADASRLVLPPVARNELTALGTRALLQSTLYSEGRYIGLISFEMCRGPHKWTRIECEAIVAFADMIERYL